MEINFDPYEALPFLTYGDFTSDEIKQDHCCSLMHYVEAEKFLGVDERYRRFILSIKDKEDFLLETAGVSQAMRRSDWYSVRDSLIKAGAWMQIVQNKSPLLELLNEGNLVCNLAPINDAMKAIRDRLTDGEPLRQVLITGDINFRNKDAVFSMLDSIFARRQADEILITTEMGVARDAARYAHARYIPLRIVGVGAPSYEDAAEEAMRYASHVFVATHDGKSSRFSETCFHAATETGKTAHKIELEQLCA